MSWLLFAVYSAAFAALTAIFAKIGIKDVDSHLATAVRTVVILFFAWGIVFWQGNAAKIAAISPFSFAFLILSGITTGLSWLFYFRALKLGKASQVAPIDKLSLVLTVVLASVILKEKITPGILIGGIFMAIGAMLISLG